MAVNKSKKAEYLIGTCIMNKICKKKMLRDGESNPGLPRDRRGYSPLYYRGDVW